MLWWFVAVGGVVCLLGLAGQLHWYRLYTPAQPATANWGVPVYAEYFAGALLCSARSARRTVWLPVWGFAVQAAALMGSALLFGSGAYPRLELLRAWSSGSFSRMDALLLLLWLLCAVYRAVHAVRRNPVALAAAGSRGAAMRKQKSCKPLLYLLLTGWCLLFLRCESTEKSMVRAVYLAQTEQGYQAGLLYQAPQAAADAAEASAALQFVQAEGQTMERALAAAEQALPQTASYRLCDYLLLPKAEEPLLTEYEQLVLRRGCGRTAARLLCAEGETGHLVAQATLPDALMAQIKAAAPNAPRLYQHTEPGLLPVLRWSAKEVTIQEGGVLHTVAS